MNPPSLSGNLENISFDRGTVLRMNAVLMTPQLRHVLKDGDVKASDIAEWPQKAWKAYEFLATRVSRVKESKQDVAFGAIAASVPLTTADPALRASITATYGSLLGEEILDILAEWSDADRTPAGTGGLSAREMWEKDPANQDRKQRTQEAVTALHAVLTDRIRTYEKTADELRITSGLNSIENALRTTKEYVWDEFWDHPEMSAGLVISMYMAYQHLKGTKAWTMIKYAIAGSAGYTFLKDRFGIAPTEKVAELAERVGLGSVATGIRGFRDTLHRALVGPKGEGAINHYYYERLGFQREDKRIAFNFLLQENPKQFLEWYDSAKKWKMGSTENPPQETRALLRRMNRVPNLPAYFLSLSPAQQTQLLLDVSETVFTDLAKVNGENDPSAAKGLVILRAKYVDGSYFNLLWNRFNEELTDFEEKYGMYATVKEQIGRVRREADRFHEGMRRRVQLGSDQIQFMDILYVEGDSKAIAKHGGVGAMAMAEMEDALKKGWEAMQGLPDDAKKAFEKIWGGIDFYASGVYKFWGDVWRDTIKPFLEQDVAGKAAEYIDALERWYEDPAKQTAIQQAKAAGENVILSVKDSCVADLLKQVGLTAVSAVEMTLEQVRELAEWIREKTEEVKLNRALQGFSGDWVVEATGAKKFKLKITSPIKDHTYQLFLKFEVFDPATGMMLDSATGALLSAGNPFEKTFDYPNPANARAFDYDIDVDSGYNISAVLATGMVVQNVETYLEVTTPGGTVYASPKKSITVP